MDPRTQSANGTTQETRATNRELGEGRERNGGTAKNSKTTKRQPEFRPRSVTKHFQGRGRGTKDEDEKSSQDVTISRDTFAAVGSVVLPIRGGLNSEKGVEKVGRFW